MKKLLPFLAVATLALASCAGEPSDWTADKKVSLDVIPPGTRPSDNFDQATNAAPSQEKGGAVAEPMTSGTTTNPHGKPTASEAMSADTQTGTAEAPGEGQPKDDGTTKAQNSDAPNAPKAGENSDTKPSN